MTSKIRHSAELHTHEHEDFFKIKVLCEHDYYTNKECVDLAFKLTKSSAELLKQKSIFFKEEGNSLLIGRGKLKDVSADNGFNYVLPPDFPPIVIRIEIQNPRFWLVTKMVDSTKYYFYNYKAEKKEQIERAKLSKVEIIERNVYLFSKDEGKTANQYNGLVDNSKTLSFKEVEAYKQKNLSVYSNELDFSSNIFGFLILDLNQMNTKKEEVRLRFNAPSIQLKYNIKLRGEKNEVSNILGNVISFIEAETSLNAKLSLEVKKDKRNNTYNLISTEAWKMQQDNSHLPKGFFKFDVEVEKHANTERMKAEVYLPFPKNIQAILKKDKDSREVFIEQNVNFLRFSKKS